MLIDRSMQPDATDWPSPTTEPQFMAVPVAPPVPAEAPPEVPVAAPRVSVVIPTLNEEQNIAWVLERLPAIVDEVILVDGRSTDDTVAVARHIRPDIRVVLETQPGKGAALRAGFAAATGEYIVMIDADGSMDPAEIVRFVDALHDGYDFVKGSRFTDGGGTSDISRIRQLGNDALRRAVNILYRTNFTDLCYGFIGFRRGRLDALRLDSRGFEIETEMVARAVVASLRIREVPSFEAERRSGESHLRAWRDGRRALATLLHERFILPESPMPPAAPGPPVLVASEERRRLPMSVPAGPAAR